MTHTVDCSRLSEYAFPRTGKRGVPQQFPRRLFTMLESETRLLEENPNRHMIIGWSDSGNAFRIFNVTEFSVTILPKYFRTKKFSSFQRNLNLYGFTKVRRGPESDMYAHPSFVRNQPKGLLELRKINAAGRRRSISDESHMSITTTGARPVSPSLSGTRQGSPSTISRDGNSGELLLHHLPVPKSVRLPFPLETQGEKAKSPDRGRLDLLALAMEQEFSSCSESSS